MANLDHLCADFGFQIVPRDEIDFRTMERELTKALGILQENGLYALFVYLQGQTTREMKRAKQKLWAMVDKLEDERIIQLEGDTRDQQAVALTANLNQMLLVKDLLERTMVYARYRAMGLRKAQEEQEAARGEEAG